VFVRFDNHDSKVASKIHSIAEREELHLEIVDHVVITRVTLFRCELRFAAQRDSAEKSHRSSRLIRITSDTSDSYNRVQSGFYPASILYPSTRRFFSRFSAARNGFNSCFCFSARDVDDVSPGH